EDGELGEHAHVGALQAQRSLQQSDELLEVCAVLIVADQVLQLVSVDHNVEAADLCQPELLAIHTRKTHLYLLPCPCAVGLPAAVHSRLVLPEVDERRCEASEVGNIVVQELGCVIHALIITSITHLVSYLLYVSIVGPTDKLLQLCQTLCLYIRLSRFLSSHLEEFDQVFPVICKTQHLRNQLAQERRSEVTVLQSEGLLFLLAALTTSMVNGFDIRVDSLLHQIPLQLSSG
ncbi:hypothetical protein F7725_013093, partial [Dissostichus mawsoni]